jgi:hypothetical protein
VGIYGKSTSSGNAPAPESVATLSSQGCQADEAALAALKPLARGEVAAMAVQQAPVQLPVLSFTDAVVLKSD